MIMLSVRMFDKVFVFFVIPAQTLRRSPKQMYWLILIEEHFMFRLN